MIQGRIAHSAHAGSADSQVMQAHTGMMSINRGATGIPQRIEMLAIDFSTRIYAFQAIAAAEPIDITADAPS